MFQLCDLRVIENAEPLLDKTVQKALAYPVEEGSCLGKFNQFQVSCTPEGTTLEAMRRETVEACCLSMINNACIKRSLAATDPQCQSSLYNHQRTHNERLEERCAPFGAIKCDAPKLSLTFWLLLLLLTLTLTTATAIFTRVLLL